MNVLLIDHDCGFLHTACLCEAHGHSVKLFQPAAPGGRKRTIGDGMVDKVEDWKKWMKWADLILPSDNAYYIEDLAPFFKSGFPIFGSNEEGSRLETDRVWGQEVLEKCGIEVQPYFSFQTYDQAIAHVRSTKKPYAAKHWGGTANKALSYVGKDPADIIFKLERWKREHKLKAGLILQELVEGQEVAIGGWFGPGGFSKWLCENWEEKRFMNEGLGVNTGEQGTVLRYVTRSKLFRDVLEPLGEYLHSINYIGYVDINCIVDSAGEPKPLEWTNRFGWPLFNIQTFLHKGDPVEWMVDLLEGRDSLECNEQIAVGVVLSHGEYPRPSSELEEGYPLYGLDAWILKRLALVECKMDCAPMLVGSDIVEVDTFCTAGNYVGVAVGLAESVKKASDRAYEVSWLVNLPNNRMFRTDIGERLKKDLPALQRHGYCLNMKYE